MDRLWSSRSLMSSKKHKPPIASTAPKSSGGGTVSGLEQWESNQAMIEELFEQQKTNPVQAGRASGMWQELDYSVPQKMPGAQQGGADRYNLSFRDKSGFKGSTSEAFLNKANAGNKWKGLRLDHGPNVKTGNQTNWHWNQKGAMNAFGRPDHMVAGSAGARTGAALKAIKPIARKATFIGAGMDAISLGQEVAESSSTGEWGNTVEKGAEIAGGWAGAYGGAKALGTGGAALGTMIAPGIGTIIGGALGGLLGGIGGYMGGSALGRHVAGQRQ